MSRYHVFWTNSSLAYLTAMCVMGFWWMGSVWDFALLFYLPDFHVKAWWWHGFWLLLWSVGLFWVQHRFRQIKMWRYDKHSRNVILGQWHKIGWHDLEIHHINQFIGIRAEEIHSAHTAQYGRIILLHSDSVTETEIHRVFPSKNGSLNTQYEYKNIAKIMQLPMLQLDKIDHAAQGRRTANPEHFQAAQSALAAKAERPANWVLVLRGIWSMVWLALGGGLLYLAWLADNVFLLLFFGLLGLAFVSYAGYGGYETWRMYQSNQSDTNILQPQQQPERAVHFARQSAAFSLFPRSRVLIWTAIIAPMGCMIVWGHFSRGDWERTFLGAMFALSLLAGGVSYWNGLFLNKKLHYDAQNDTFTFYKMNAFLRWQPEKTQSAREFVGIAWEKGDEIWLIGVSGSQDVFLGKSSQAEEIIKQINQKTGLAMVQRKQ